MRWHEEEISAARDQVRQLFVIAEANPDPVGVTGREAQPEVLITPVPGAELCRSLAQRGFLVGPDLGRYFPELGNCVLLAATEKRDTDDIDALVEALEKELAER